MEASSLPSDVGGEKVLLVIDDDVRQWGACLAGLAGWRVVQAAWRDLRCHVPAGRLPRVWVRQAVRRRGRGRRALMGCSG
jgi:hypothetical protein